MHIHIRQAVWYVCSNLFLVQTLYELNMATCLQIPEDEQESYTKGQHLRGADAKNADRVRAEIVRLLRPLLSTVSTDLHLGMCSVKTSICDQGLLPLCTCMYASCRLHHAKPGRWQNKF